MPNPDNPSQFSTYKVSADDVFYVSSVIPFHESTKLFKRIKSHIIRFHKAVKFPQLLFWIYVHHAKLQQ